MGESSEIALTYAKIFLRELSPKNDFLDTATWVFFNDSSLEFWTSVSVESAKNHRFFGSGWLVGFKDFPVGIPFF